MDWGGIFGDVVDDAKKWGVILAIVIIIWLILQVVRLFH
jgi:hypothetical protein